MIASILELKLQFLLSELGMTIDISLKLDRYLCCQLCMVSLQPESLRD